MKFHIGISIMARVLETEQTLKPEALDDAQLIELISSTGDTEHFGLLYDRYSNKVYRKCLSIVKDQSTAQDLVHDIMVKIFLSLPKFQGRSRFSSWVYAITYNKCIDYLRNQKKLKESELDPERDGEAEEDDAISEQELASIKASRLKELLWKLSESDRMILMMKYMDELPVKEIEELLNIKSSAVKMRLKRARERLLELYQVQYGGEEDL
jgi:RNA polymerase sigma-70 factor (ECF subfamily)